MRPVRRRQPDNQANNFLFTYKNSVSFFIVIKLVEVHEVTVRDGTYPNGYCAGNSSHAGGSSLRANCRAVAGNGLHYAAIGSLVPWWCMSGLDASRQGRRRP